MGGNDNWRQEGNYLHPAPCDLVDMAWEYLRRDPDYRASATSGRSLARWGIHFRAAAGGACRRSSGHLAA